MVDALRPEFNHRVAFVTADLSTSEGQIFAARLGVGETTLVFFDRGGTPINRYQGTATQANLRRLIVSSFGAGEIGPETSRSSAELERSREAIDRYNENAKRIIQSMGR